MGGPHDHDHQFNSVSKTDDWREARQQRIRGSENAVERDMMTGRGPVIQIQLSKRAARAGEKRSYS